MLKSLYMYVVSHTLFDVNAALDVDKQAKKEWILCFKVADLDGWSFSVYRQCPRVAKFDYYTMNIKTITTDAGNLS